MSASLAVRVQGALLLHDIDAFPPVNPAKVVSQYTSGAGLPRESWKEALKFTTVPVEY